MQGTWAQPYIHCERVLSEIVSVVMVNIVYNRILMRRELYKKFNMDGCRCNYKSDTIIAEIFSMKPMFDAFRAAIKERQVGMILQCYSFYVHSQMLMNRNSLSRKLNDLTQIISQSPFWICSKLYIFKSR